MENKPEEKDRPLIIFSDEEWAKLAPLRAKWTEGSARLAAIKKEAEKLSKEAAMITATADYHRDLFWAEVNAMYPATAESCQHFEDDPPRVEKCTHGETGFQIGTMEDMPPHLRAMLGKLFRGL